MERLYRKYFLHFGYKVFHGITWKDSTENTCYILGIKYFRVLRVERLYRKYFLHFGYKVFHGITWKDYRKYFLHFGYKVFQGITCGKTLQKILFTFFIVLMTFFYGNPYLLTKIWK